MKYRVKYGQLTVRCRTLWLAVIVLMLMGTMLFPLEAQQKVSRQSALDAFSKGKFELAYNQFTELLVTFPRDPVYKYYSGVCLVKLQKDPDEATDMLLQARRDGAVVRSVPQDALFWLGRAQQMAGRFTEAIDSFNEFTELAGRKAARELGTPEFIQQCQEKRGQVARAEDEVKAKAEAEAEAEVKVKVEDKVEVEAEAEAEAEAEVKDKAKTEVEDEIPAYRPAGTEVYKRKADSSAAVAAAGTDTLKAEKPVKPASPPVLQDSTFKAVIDEHVAAAVKQPASAGALSLFSIDPELVYKRDEKIRINPKHPAGLIYRIQLAAFRNQVAISYFKGITPVYGIRNASTGVTTYYAGMFRNIDDTRKALPQVRQTGFKDAFIVAFSGGKPVSLQRAAILEKEWGIIPFMPDEQIIKEIQADTIPPTLSFRVEVVRTEKPVSEESYEELKKLSGTRGLDIESLPDGKIVYLIGKFITFESAENYADLLVRNGYRDAKVAAWLGKREIPVETAKQLFENLK